MKIGVYTLFRSNYGAVLQAYSLQRTIKELFPSDEVLMVDFKTKNHESHDSVFGKYSKNIIFNVVWNFFVLLRYKQFKTKNKSFKEFHQKEFDYTSSYTSQQQLLANPPELDIHLSGSDQVFNPNNVYRDVYYLTFKKNNKSKKVAYAPSFGISSFTDEARSYIKKHLSDFDCLSCREKNGAELLTELLGREVPHVLDPVFLTPMHLWDSISVKPKVSGKYIFIYGLKGTKKLLQFAKQTYPGTKIVALTPNDLRFYTGCQQVYYPGPREFVGLIANAEAVVTDSFHGSAFSIIFKKNFHTIITRPSVSSRIVSLLSELKLQKHIVTNISAISASNTLEIEYQTILEQWVLDSKQFLIQALDNQRR